MLFLDGAGNQISLGGPLASGGFRQPPVPVFVPEVLGINVVQTEDGLSVSALLNGSEGYLDFILTTEFNPSASDVKDGTTAPEGLPLGTIEVTSETPELMLEGKTLEYLAEYTIACVYRAGVMESEVASTSFALNMLALEGVFRERWDAFEVDDGTIELGQAGYQPDGAGISIVEDDVEPPVKGLRITAPVSAVRGVSPLLVAGVVGDLLVSQEFEYLDFLLRIEGVTSGAPRLGLGFRSEDRLLGLRVEANASGFHLLNWSVLRNTGQAVNLGLSLQSNRPCYANLRFTPTEMRGRAWTASGSPPAFSSPVPIHPDNGWLRDVDGDLVQGQFGLWCHSITGTSTFRTLTYYSVGINRDAPLLGD